MADRRIRYVKLDDLQGNPANPKSHDLDLIGESLDRFGYVEPQTMDDRTGLLVAGHGRLEQLQSKQNAGEDPPEGIRRRGSRWYVPVVFGWSSADDDEALAYLVASNQSTIAGGWNYPALAPVLEQVAASKLELAGTGYTRERLDDLLEQIEAGRQLDTAPPSVEPEREREIPKRVTRGDLWQLGPHRMLCGDCRDPADVDRLLAGAAVNVAFTSPPYADRRKYDESSGFVPIHPDAYVEWFEPVARNVGDHLAADGSWFVNIKAGAADLDTETYVLDLVLAHRRAWGWHWLTEFCWERNGVPKQVVMRFKNQFEPIYQFVKGRPKVRADNVRHESDQAIIPFGPGRGNTSWADPESAVVSQGQRGDLFEGQRPDGRRARKNGDTTWGRPGPDGEIRQGSGRNAIPTDLPDPDVMVGAGWAFPGNRLPTFAGTHEATGHTAAYPVGLPAWFIRAFSDAGDVIFDPFVGSGSTILAADENARLGYGIELSPGYCDVILDRWERHDGEPPVKIDTIP